MCSTYSFPASITSRALFFCSWSRSNSQALSTASKAFWALSASSSFLPGCSYWNLLFISSSVTSGPIWKITNDFRLKQAESKWVNHSIWFWGFRPESVLSICFIPLWSEGHKFLLLAASTAVQSLALSRSHHFPGQLPCDLKAGILKNCFSHGGNLWPQLKTSDIIGNSDILCHLFPQFLNSAGRDHSHYLLTLHPTFPN